MFTVALIGPDGAGKTTISQRMKETLPWKVKYLYMGVNPDSSNHVLPTTALIRAFKRAIGAKRDVGGPPGLERTQCERRGMLRDSLRAGKSLLSLAHRLSEETYRQLLTWSFQLRGHVVLYDRHYFIDYFAYDIAPCDWRRPLARRLHGWWLDRVFPKPNLVIYLDAPSEVLWARKGEGTVEALERRRRDYLDIRDHVPHFVVVDANRDADQVAADVTEVMLSFAQTRADGRSRPANGAAWKVAHATSKVRGGSS